MPWTMIECAHCAINVPIDEAVAHFRICKTMPAPYIQMLVDMVKDDKRHQQLQLTTTMLLACPRAMLIPKFYDLVIDPTRRLPLTAGTSWHAHMAEFHGDGWISEKCTCPPPFPLESMSEELQREQMAINGMTFINVDGHWHLEGCNSVRCTFFGELNGYPISGKVDALEVNADGTIDIYDWKMRSAYKSRMGEPELEDICQLNINRLLAEQNGHVVNEMHSGQFLWTNILFQAVPFMTWEEIQLVRPHPGQEGVPPTIGETLSLYAESIEAINSGRDVASVIDNNPMVGEQMYRKGRSTHMCNLYCDCLPMCAGLRFLRKE